MLFDYPGDDMDHECESNKINIPR